MVRKLIYILLTILLLVSCSKIRQITDEITQPTAREMYQREFGTHNFYTAWSDAYSRAKSDSVQVDLPYGETGKFRPLHNTAYSYTVNLTEGEILTAEVQRDSTHHKVFIDIFEQGTEKAVAASAGSTIAKHPILKTGFYKVVVQAELIANTDFKILLSKSPMYGFPVAGKGNSAIQSFWGYERDGGKRSHEGVDVFAARGTPVVAVSAGVISNVGDRGLGGKQVWQRVGGHGHSVYYAHLDSIKAVAGQRVVEGDTVGFVGSTGNAKGGPPHLHFGIYRNYEGAVDPLAFIFKHPKNAAPQYKVPNTTKMQVKSSAATLRLGPSTSYANIGTLNKATAVKVLGRHKEWLHIETIDYQKGFIHQSLVTAQ